MNICLFLPNWLGDLVMAVPAIRAIRARFGPGARIVGITRPNLAGLLSGSNWINEFWYYDPRTDDPRFDTFATIQRLRTVRWDQAILFTNSLRTALLAVAGGIPERIGYARDGRAALLTHALPVPRDGGQIRRVPMVDYYLGLARAIGADSDDRRLELPLSLWGEVCADRVWKDLNLPTHGPVIAMHVGGAFGASKCWPPAHFVELARRIVTSTPAWVLFVCGHREREVVRRIAREVSHPKVVSMADQPLDLQTLKSCLHRCTAMVSTDSGPRHMAAALGKPVVTLFGPTWPVVTANPTVESIDLQVSLDCVPCGQPRCPLGHHRCMEELSPDMVFQAVLPYISRTQFRSVA
ncbi:ADP-heptose--lipooligosaccharide heptosyltransferase II [Thermogutta terrifontis]|uniref:lipopolysaccharide heptosyltransferase II n=1 Tax=Thermogutta terrifontis TaxID=1331910 RepID=A0A286RJZ1_9BACT|nr:lipopolysaccharide heptosyltransferase II [Thermogutta terrifontis]ASV76242.1 ADP-heptose--lipooligosaccharide heptosyltransferase II [Thermogutta terrifontis]